MLGGIASGWGLPADVSDIRACSVLRWALSERRPVTPRAARLDLSGGGQHGGLWHDDDSSALRALPSILDFSKRNLFSLDA
jgi:hypothetical protein